MAEGRILSIDYGSKRVGIALSDPLKIIASPYDTFENNSVLIEKIVILVKEKDVVRIIVGYPLNGDGTKTVLSDIIENFSKKIELETGVPVELYDERFSSSIASERILQSVAKKSKRRNKSLVDKFAAAVILEDYLKEFG